VNHIKSTPYFIPNTLDTTASKVLKLLVCIMKLQLKRIDLDRTVFGIYRTTAFCNQHDHWGNNSRTVKENIDDSSDTFGGGFKSD
jgi:hypothetical protein